MPVPGGCQDACACRGQRDVRVVRAGLVAQCAVTEDDVCALRGRRRRADDRGPRRRVSGAVRVSKRHLFLARGIELPVVPARLVRAWLEPLADVCPLPSGCPDNAAHRQRAHDSVRAMPARLFCQRLWRGYSVRQVRAWLGTRRQACVRAVPCGRLRARPRAKRQLLSVPATDTLAARRRAVRRVYTRACVECDAGKLQRVPGGHAWRAGGAHVCCVPTKCDVRPRRGQQQRVRVSAGHGHGAQRRLSAVPAGVAVSARHGQRQRCAVRPVRRQCFGPLCVHS